jgi:hypothetical protein
MGQAERPTCPNCGALLILALPPGGKGQRTLQCFDCERPDPLKTNSVIGWLEGELGRTRRLPEQERLSWRPLYPKERKPDAAKDQYRETDTDRQQR